MLNKLYKILPVANFVISSSALFFQVTVLYPWHKDLSKDIQKIDKQLYTMKKQIASKTYPPIHIEHVKAKHTIYDDEPCPKI